MGFCYGENKPKRYSQEACEIGITQHVKFYARRKIHVRYCGECPFYEPSKHKVVEPKKVEKRGHFKKWLEIVSED